MSNNNQNQLKTNQKLFELAFELCKLMDKGADAALPTEIAKVVKDHAKIAVGSAASAAVPGVGSTIAVTASAAAIWSMYVRINNKLGLKLSDNAIKTIATGAATNLASYVVMSGAVSAVFSFFPGLGTGASILVMSASMYAITLTSGFVYLKALIALTGKKTNISEGSVKNAINSVLADKSSVKSIFNEFKNNYKK